MKTSLKKPRKNVSVNLMTIVVALIIVFVIFSIVLGKLFLSSGNMSSIAFQIPEFGFITLAMAFSMLSGGCDLSVVSIANLGTIIGGKLILSMSENGTGPTTAIISGFFLALIICAICGLLNGFLIAKIHINYLLATLATSIFFKGVGMVITEGNTVVGFPEEFAKLGLFKIGALPFGLVLLIIASLICWFVVAQTHFGTSLMLFGENNVVALFSGIKNTSLIFKTYLLSGILTGIGGILMTLRVNSAKVDYGATYEMQTILVCVLGGVSTHDGGKDKIPAVMLGILLLQLLQNGFTLLGIQAYYKSFIWGAVLIGVLVANYFVTNQKK